MDVDWQRSAACRDVDSALFFDGPRSMAVRVCQGCPVRRECLEYALAIGADLGVWGGCAKTERARIAARRTRDAA